MTDSALNIYSGHLAEQLGEDGPFTELAVYDPSGEDINIYGVFDDNTYRENKDSANIYQKITGPRFVVSSVNQLNFNVYDDKELYIPKRNKIFKIDYVDTDEQGSQVIWLQG